MLFIDELELLYPGSPLTEANLDRVSTCRITRKGSKIPLATKGTIKLLLEPLELGLLRYNLPDF